MHGCSCCKQALTAQSAVLHSLLGLGIDRKKKPEKTVEQKAHEAASDAVSTTPGADSDGCGAGQQPAAR